MQFYHIVRIGIRFIALTCRKCYTKLFNFICDYVVKLIWAFTCKYFYMKKSVFFTVLFIILLSSCEKNVTIEIPEKEPRLTVSGFVAKGESFRVTIGKSRH